MTPPTDLLLIAETGGNRLPSANPDLLGAAGAYTATGNAVVRVLLTGAGPAAAAAVFSGG